ncbi:hypothetical protein J0X19_12080 [Hymenobacter sp. BT186]|uniref:Uncharacterized protein n=1 Tax=Hymenobacter telluris TaxID=2816474 RepID=A0A939EY01_9BACT|nr:hypothetical protein [Hymenobacter telluris]MBO0358687.1 hypothetical protein [Hymenobacter telluris]MBW3374713.1 hypothetical protein [Hymenobacter norwichensis]
MNHAIATMPASPLSRRDRAWIALYSLDNRHYNRNYNQQYVLWANNVTEQDLAEFEDSWLKLRCRPTEQ